MTVSKLAKLLALLPLAVGLTQCDRVHALFHPKPKAPGPYAFDMILRMSPRAEAALKKPNANLYVDAEYYGDAKPAFHDQADKLNRIDLGEERWNYSAAARRVHLHGDTVDLSKLSQTSNGQVQIIVSVVAQNGDPDNLLSCHDYIGLVSAARQSPPVVNCEFDTETYWDDVAAGSAQ